MTDASTTHPNTVGGGTKKVLYTLRSVKRIGVAQAAKALRANNTCKACGLGMGGQLGGMTNELGEFPAVCNKSVQAQLTDTQPAIPQEIFEHSLDELRELDGHELEHLGRLNTPLLKSPDSNQFVPIEWAQAIQLAAERLRATNPQRSFFYSSGRSSNEAGFLLQLFARLYGTNNVNNCSYYCHQATSVALGHSIGTGTATIELADLTGCDFIFVIGANPSSNHPRFIHQLKACRERGGQVVIINPAKEPGLVRFAVPKSPRSLLSGGSAIASDYLQPRIGSDIALLKGIAKALLQHELMDAVFIQQYTEHYAEFAADLQRLTWAQIEQACGVERHHIERVALSYGRAKNAVFAWGMGMTHHLHGVQNIEQIANLALIRGMIGRPFAGLLPLRGHSNVQGIGTIGVKPVLASDVFDAMQTHFGVRLPQSQGLDTMSCMQAADRGEMDAALIMGGNLYEANPNSAWSGQALGKIPFKLFLTTTLNRGHIYGSDQTEALILPVTARDEERQPTTQESMFNYVRMSDGGLSRQANARPEVDILCDLASEVLPNCPVDFQTYRNHRTIRQAIAATVPGMHGMASIDEAKKEFHVAQRLLHEPHFNTPSGRARFRIADIPAAYQQPPSEQHYVLTTVRSEGQFNSIVYEYEDSYRNSADRWVVFMNPLDIEAHQLTPEARVDLHSDTGCMANVRVQAYDLPRHNLMAYYPEANCLTQTETDPQSKTPAFKSTRVQIKQRH